MSDVKQANPFEHIQSLCRDFRRQLKSGTPTRIEDYLDRVEKSSREMLFQNLLHVEIEFRRRQGEQASSDQYADRFPDLMGLVRQAFFESTILSMGPHVDTPANEKTVLYGMPAARKLGDYELLRELGRGGFGVVYEAKHLQRNDLVALKTLPTLMDGQPQPLDDAGRLHRFRREFRSLSEINHPNLVGMQSLEVEGRQWFFTMDLIQGKDFITHVRPQGEFDESRLRPALAQLVTGVLALHRNYIIHRDLKPSNVMVDEDGRVVVLDFGLVLEQQRTSLAETENGITGSPAYMSPEQAMSDTATTTSDWYSVGVMLYEALTGQVPFSGSVLKVLQDKQQQPAPSLPRDSDLPNDLCDLCEALLATKPSDRPDPAEIAHSVAYAGAPTESVTPSRPHGLIGRETHLAKLRTALSDFNDRGQPVAVFIDGRSGEGKTSLCDAFLEPFRQHSRYALLSGRCYDRESVPFRALDTVIDAICGYLNGLTTEAVNSVLPRDVQALQHTFPVFGRVKAIRASQSANLSELDDHEVRNRAFLAMRELLGRISDRQPVILFVDDLQWGDTDSAEVLMQVLRGPNPPRVYFLGTYRTDEADDSRFLTAWQTIAKQQQIEVDTRSLSVGPLTADECRQLMIEMLDTDTEVVRRRATEFFEQTAGNAFLFTELVGCFDPDADSFHQIPVNQIIDNKLRDLPPEATTLLQLISVSGQALQTSEVATAAGLEAVPMATLTRMRNARLIRFVGEETTPIVDTYHDRIRETVLAELDKTQAIEQHRLLGQAIEQIHGGLTEEQLQSIEQGNFELNDDAAITRLFDLSFHFSAANDSRKGFAYSVLAAEQARRQFSLEAAVPKYVAGRVHFDHVNQTAQYQLLLRLGETLRLLGRYSEAEEALSAALPLSQDVVERCAVENVQAEACRQAGRYEESAKRFATSLRSMGIVVPNSTPGLIFGIAKQVAIQALHTLRGYPRPSSPPAGPRELLITKLLFGYNMSVWFRNTPNVLWTCLASLNRAERFAPSRELILSHSLHSAICMVLKIENRGRRYLDRVSTTTSDDDFGMRLLHHFHAAVGHYSGTRFVETQQHADQGLAVLERSGDVWRGLLLKLHFLLAEYRLGHLESALKSALDGFAESVRLGDPNTAHDYLNLVAMITGGRFRFDEMNSALTPIPDNFQATNQKLQAEARWHLHCGRIEEGYRVAEEGFQLMKKHVVINHITNTNFPLILKAIRLYADDIQSTDPAAAKAELKKGYRRAKWANRITLGGPDHAATLRELAIYHEKRGHIRKALKVLQRSCEVADQYEMKAEAIESRCLHTTLSAQYGLATQTEADEATEVLSQLRSQLDELFKTQPYLRDLSETDRDSIANSF
ncbi:serine/threonine-protein kinase [Thalassoroseus pseudoceratinae]|uniref:serine/threonine-protein kinase n=1 Tax=Thalassoroseus pseudoceratinae TaxID=2713176 RepID=UPI00141F5FB0|nr:serine/threonine-protein kinase [Thalassoroseus pseudoceratinae]